MGLIIASRGASINLSISSLFQYWENCNVYSWYSVSRYLVPDCITTKIHPRMRRSTDPVTYLIEQRPGTIFSRRPIGVQFCLRC